MRRLHFQRLALSESVSYCWRRIAKENLRMRFRLRAEKFFRARQASSRKVTSNCQCRRFSIPQCSLIWDHCASPPLHSFHLLASRIGVFRLRSGMPVSRPYPLSEGSSFREGAFLGYLVLWSRRSPGIRFRLYAIASKIIVCHSFQDILCMRSLKPSVATSPS